MSRIELEPAYVLHRRAYRNTSWVVEFFTEHHGRVAAVARSARGLKSRYRGKIDLFMPMLISWSGRGELKTLGQVEFSSVPMPISGDALLCGFYLNEIILRLLHSHDPHPQLFYYYQAVLQDLSTALDVPVALRLFEKRLLQELGYGLSLTEELKTGFPIEAAAFYEYRLDQGFVRVASEAVAADVFSGESLLALHNEQFLTNAVRHEVKRLMRFVLAHHLGERPIKSRALLHRPRQPITF